ncbi:MAG: hypothetical protein ACOX3T_05415 [Bdellovibrionota bacterium]
MGGYNIFSGNNSPETKERTKARGEVTKGNKREEPLKNFSFNKGKDGETIEFNPTDFKKVQQREDNTQRTLDLNSPHDPNGANTPDPNSSPDPNNSTNPQIKYDMYEGKFNMRGLREEFKEAVAKYNRISDSDIADKKEARRKMDKAGKLYDAELEKSLGSEGRRGMSNRDIFESLNEEQRAALDYGTIVLIIDSNLEDSKINLTEKKPTRASNVPAKYKDRLLIITGSTGNIEVKKAKIDQGASLGVVYLNKTNGNDKNNSIEIVIRSGQFIHAVMVNEGGVKFCFNGTPEDTSKNQPANIIVLDHSILRGVKKATSCCAIGTTFDGSALGEGFVGLARAYNNRIPIIGRAMQAYYTLTGNEKKSIKLQVYGLLGNTIWDKTTAIWPEGQTIFEEFTKRFQKGKYNKRFISPSTKENYEDLIRELLKELPEDKKTIKGLMEAVQENEDLSDDEKSFLIQALKTVDTDIKEYYAKMCRKLLKYCSWPMIFKKPPQPLDLTDGLERLQKDPCVDMKKLNVEDLADYGINERKFLNNVDKGHEHIYLIVDEDTGRRFVTVGRLDGKLNVANIVDQRDPKNGRFATFPELYSDDIRVFQLLRKITTTPEEFETRRKELKISDDDLKEVFKFFNLNENNPWETDGRSYMENYQIFQDRLITWFNSRSERYGNHEDLVQYKNPKITKEVEVGGFVSEIKENRQNTDALEGFLIKLPD